MLSDITILVLLITNFLGFKIIVDLKRELKKYK